MDTSRNTVWNISSFIIIDADDDDVDAELEVEAPIESKTHQNMSHFIYTIKKERKLKQKQELPQATNHRQMKLCINCELK